MSLRPEPFPFEVGQKRFIQMESYLSKEIIVSENANTRRSQGFRNIETGVMRFGCCRSIGEAPGMVSSINDRRDR
jgi:hypothetical protein